MEDQMDIVVMAGAVMRRDTALLLRLLIGYYPMRIATKEQIIHYLEVQDETNRTD